MVCAYAKLAKLSILSVTSKHKIMHCVLSGRKDHVMEASVVHVVVVVVVEAEVLAEVAAEASAEVAVAGLEVGVEVSFLNLHC